MEAFDQEGDSQRSKSVDYSEIIRGNWITDRTLLAYRILGMVLSSVLSMYILINQHIRAPIYLSNWGVFIVTAQFIALSLSFNYRNAQVVAVSMYELTWSTQWLITILFWVAIYTPQFELFMAIAVHGGMFLLIFIDYCLCCHSMKLSNWRIVFLPIVFYLIFCIAVSVTINPVYPVLTFTNFVSYLYIALGIVILLGSLILGHKLGRYKHSDLAFNEVQMDPIL
mmetsp:Transcript_6935/g.12608  ORF Transcript_6935/g.12608 Transcript_6935/m.12608 type:complete len:225 (+) Transcript_6935:67-741(+)